jgi:hypothetical protein
MFSESISDASAAGAPSDADPVRAEIWLATTLVDGESGACPPTSKWKLTAPSGLPILSSKGRVDLGGRPPRSPTDPDVRVKRIWLFIS